MDRDNFIKSYEMGSAGGKLRPGVVLGALLILLDFLLMSGILRFEGLRQSWMGTPLEHFVPGPKMGIVLTLAGLALIIYSLLPDRYTGMDLYYDKLVFHRPKGEDEIVNFDEVETIITSQQGRGFDKTLFIRFENRKNRQILLPEHSPIPEDVAAAWTSYCRTQNRLLEEEEERERREGHHSAE